MNNEDLVRELSKLRPSSTFLSIKGYENSEGEIADYSIVFHISYKSLLERSIHQLESYVPVDDVELTAKHELLESYTSSLDKINSEPLEELKDGYQHFTDVGGKQVKGVKLHLASQTLHLYGLVIDKKVTKSVEYKKVNSKPLTIAKNKLKKDLPISKWRQFKITTKQVKQINVEKLTYKL